MGANGYETKAFTLIVYIRILIPWAVRDIDRTVPFQANSAPTSLRKCRQTSSISLFVLHSLMHPFCFRILRLLTKAGLSPPWIPSLRGHQPHSPLFLSRPLAFAHGLLSSASRHTEPPLLKQKHKATHKASPARPCLCSQALPSSSSFLFKRGPWIPPVCLSSSLLSTHRSLAAVWHTPSPRSLGSSCHLFPSLSFRETPSWRETMVEFHRMVILLGLRELTVSMWTRIYSFWSHWSSFQHEASVQCCSSKGFRMLRKTWKEMAAGCKDVEGRPWCWHGQAREMSAVEWSLFKLWVTVRMHTVINTWEPMCK